MIPRIIGHRGACGDAPENTLASFREAAAQGAEWVEFDVKLTADGHLVLFHDQTLNRTTDGRGPVAGRTLAELKVLDAGAWFAPRFAGECVVTLEEAVSLLAELGLGANVEIKACKGREAETGGAAAAWLRDRWPAHLLPPLISSFSARSLQAAREAAPDLARALLVRRVPDNWRERMATVGATALHCSQRRLTRARARQVVEAGTPLRCFTVNDPKRARHLFDWGVTGVFSNFPGRLRVALEG